MRRAHRPFSWKGQIYLSHWLALPPGQERAALARLDLEHGSLEHVYRFEVLQEELAKYHGRRTRTHDRSTSGLEQARAPQSSIIRILAFAAGKTDFARQKFGLMAEGLKHVRQPGRPVAPWVLQQLWCLHIDEFRSANPNMVSSKMAHFVSTASLGGPGWWQQDRA